MTLALAPAEAPTLAQLADDIRREHEACVFHAISALEHAMRAGEALLKARELVPHGEWEEWIDANCPAVAAQSRAYMRIATYREVIGPEIRTLTEGLRSLRGLPAFDGTGPQRHPPEVRDRALELVDGGLSRRMVASILGVGRNSIDRWIRQERGDGNESKRPGNYRTGRPSQRERKQRARVIAEQQRAIGPAALANYFRSVWEAHRQGERRILVKALYDLADTAVDWAEQLGERDL